MFRALPHFSTVLCLLLPVLAGAGTDLPRRAFFGAQLSPIPAAERSRAEEGVYLKTVFPDSSAAASGFQQGDILLALDGVPLTGRDAVTDAAARIGAHQAGDAVQVAYLRGSQSEERTLVLSAMPEESASDYTTRYDAVAVGNGTHRIILTTPQGGGPFPTVFYVQGLGCSSVEWPFDPENPIRQFLAGLTRSGFATLRIEKSGVGDSTGPPCEDIGFATELSAYEAACVWAKAQPELSDLYLFGHSMGGVFAPLLAQSQDVAGVMVYGTITAPLTRYFLENDERQQRLREAPEDFIADQQAIMARFCEGFLGKRQTPGALLQADSAFKPFLAIRDASDVHFHGRHTSFWHQLDDINVLDAWKQVQQPVLVLWGQCDVPASQQDHKDLAAAAPQATYVELPNMGHGFDRVESMAQSLKNRSMGPFNTAIVDTVAAWLRDHA